MDEVKSVGAYDAKTHLPQLLDEVSRGQRVMITRHGQPVAMLVPVGEPAPYDRAEALRRLKDFNKGRRLSRRAIRDLIEEGRSG